MTDDHDLEEPQYNVSQTVENGDPLNRVGCAILFNSLSDSELAGRWGLTP
ncbi:MAG: hypothetical protein KA085_16705 [Phenylobacterium sp.]|nr:hypothetical protein [Phenylobacterium sp.]MBP7817762.1 hypothetical protein [Phenylobacterium sp.]MBP9755474.1 hypothetical protein [Phenylobacterium sp.]